MICVRPCCAFLALLFAVFTAMACAPSRPDDDGGGSHAGGNDAGGSGVGAGVYDPDEIVQVELAGHGLGGPPHFRIVQSFNDDEAVELAVDPRLAPLDRTQCTVYVTAARSEAGWKDDPTLQDVRPAGAQALTIAIDPTAPLVIAAPNELSSDAGHGLGVGYDVVLDCNDNGVLDAGDVIDGGVEAGLYRTHDTTQVGPLQVAVADYSGGNFLGQRLFYPTTIDGLGVVPLVVVTHGWSYTHTYYDYIGQHLASYGYVVMAHEAEVQNGGPPGTLSAALTTLNNLDYLLANLGTIAGGVLDGHVDARKIMLTGHSTGGEAVVRAVTQLRNGSFTSAHFGYDDIKIVSSMAPVSWHDRTVVDPGDVNFHMFVAGADDDVSGAPEASYTQCQSIYERATGTRQLTYIHGAGHGDLLSCCGALYLDTSAPNLIGREETNRVARGYMLPLAELYLRDNEAARDFFRRGYGDFKPQGVAPHVVVTSEYRAARDSVIVLDDFQSETALDRSSSGGSVTFDVANAVEVLLQDNDGSLAWTGDQPSNGMTRARHAGDDPRAVVFDWTDGEARYYEQEIPVALRDFSGHGLSLRACQGTRHPETVALDGPLSFTITLRDEDGNEARIPLADVAPIPQPYQRAGFGVGSGWQNEIVSIRLGLDGFSAGGLDLSRVAAIRFDFGEAHGSSRGRLAIDDLELTAE